MKTIISEKAVACKMAAGKIVEVIRNKPAACIAFSAADLPLELFDELAECCISGEADFSKAKFFSVGEFVSGDRLGKFLSDNFLDRINVQPENRFLLNEKNFSEYDETIASFGGLDMVVLGLGENCQIGFNEPGTSFSSLTHIQKLSEPMRKKFALFFENPEKAMTLGIKSIIDADKIMVLVFGEESSDALFRTFYARNDPAIPAAFLQLSSAVSVYADPAAAAKL